MAVIQDGAVDSHRERGPLPWGSERLRPRSVMSTGFAVLEERQALVVAVISGTMWALSSRLPRLPAPEVQSSMNPGSAGKGFTAAIRVPNQLTLGDEIIQI